jgi:hypothetical protein
MDILLGILDGLDRLLQMLFTGSFTVLRVLRGSFVDMEYGLFFLCVLNCALSVTLVPTTDSSVGLSMYAVLSIALTIVHFDSTPSLSLHNIQSGYKGHKRVIGYTLY